MCQLSLTRRSTSPLCPPPQLSLIASLLRPLNLLNLLILTPAAPYVAPSVPAQAVDFLSDPPVNARYTDIPNTNMRKIIAKRLTESKATVPHFYSSIECEIDELMALRKSLKKVAK